MIRFSFFLLHFLCKKKHTQREEKQQHRRKTPIRRERERGMKETTRVEITLTQAKISKNSMCVYTHIWKWASLDIIYTILRWISEYFLIHVNIKILSRFFLSNFNRLLWILPSIWSEFRAGHNISTPSIKRDPCKFRKFT